MAFSGTWKKWILTGVCSTFLIGTVAMADVQRVTEQATRDIQLSQKPAIEPGNLSALQQVQLDELSRQDFAITCTTNKSKEGDAFKFGEEVKFTFSSDRDCYLTVLDYTPTGKMVQLFPNKWHATNEIKSGQSISIPPEKADFVMNSGGDEPANTDRVIFVATEKDSKFFDSDKQTVMGPFKEISDTTGATRQILLVDKPADPAVPTTPPVEPAVVPPTTDPVTDVAVAPPAASESVTPTADPAVVPPITPPAVTPVAPPDASIVKTDSIDAGKVSVGHIGIHNYKETPAAFTTVTKGEWQVKAWFEKAEIKVKDKMLLRIQTNQDCELIGLKNKGASNMENQLVTDTTQVKLSKNRINVLPGKPDKFSFQAVAPAGQEIIIAELMNGTEKMEVEIKVKTLE